MKRNPTNANVQEFKKAQRELICTDQKEYLSYIWRQINTIKNLVDGRQSRIGWQTVYKVSRWKSTLRVKLKGVIQKERFLKNLHKTLLKSQTNLYKTLLMRN